MPFLDARYLLPTDEAARIFDEIKALPVVDAHNHSNVQEILENKNYFDIWQVEAATDHYVWELMRKRGVPEKYITGQAPNSQKWMRLCAVFDDFVGNAVYEWMHLDLQHMLGVADRISKANAKTIWDKTLEVLQLPSNRPQELLKRMNIESMCTTDDPADVLTAHEQLAEQMGPGRIRPTWRPDKAMNIFKPDWTQYIDRLSTRVQEGTGPIKTLGDLVAGLKWTHDYFANHGCIASDHALEVPFGNTPEEKLAEKAFQKRRDGEGLNPKEIQNFLAYLLHQFGELNTKSGWVSQLHIGAVRDVRASLVTTLGPDSGGDVSRQNIAIVEPLRDFLNAFDGKLKVVLYCLDPTHLPTLATLSRAFGERVTIGAAWWFNDTPNGMKQHLEYLATVDLLMNFAGMVTDSRKILSYASRTEMFRRVLASVLGNWVKNGQVPEDLAIRLAKHVCYEGPKKFFGFDK